MGKEEGQYGEEKGDTLKMNGESTGMDRGCTLQGEEEGDTLRAT
jgi:hypothetical protein